jgi:hypothetical protein
MKLDRYPYYANPSFFDFDFESEGPKGKIRKIARFVKIRRSLYSFGFGDLDENTADISDTVVSNNGDGVKVLATVAIIVYDFTAVYRDAAIYIEGSTPARTRWYQMNIGAHFVEINTIFEIYGFHNGQWESFKKGINYKAFMGQRRQLLAQLFDDQQHKVGN